MRDCFKAFGANLRTVAVGTLIRFSAGRGRSEHDDVARQSLTGKRLANPCLRGGIVRGATRAQNDRRRRAFHAVRIDAIERHEQIDGPSRVIGRRRGTQRAARLKSKSSASSARAAAAPARGFGCVSRGHDSNADARNRPPKIRVFRIGKLLVRPSPHDPSSFQVKLAKAGRADARALRQLNVRRRMATVALGGTLKRPGLCYDPQLREGTRCARFCSD